MKPVRSVSFSFVLRRAASGEYLQEPAAQELPSSSSGRRRWCMNGTTEVTEQYKGK